MTRRDSLRRASAGLLAPLFGLVGCTSSPAPGPVSPDATVVLNAGLLAVSPDDRSVASGCLDATCVWDATTGKLSGRLPAATALAWGPTGVIALGGTDGVITLVDASGAVVRKLTGHQPGIVLDGVPGVSALAFDAAGTRLASAAHDGTVRVWNVADGKQVASLDFPTGRADLTFQDDSLVAIAPGSGPAVVWTITSDSAETLTSSPDPATAVTALPKGGLAVAGRAGTVRYSGDSPSGASLPGGTGGLRGTRGGTLAIANPEADSISVVPASGEPRTLTGQRSPNAIAFTSDGARLFSASGRDGIWEWDPATGQRVRAFDLP